MPSLALAWDARVETLLDRHPGHLASTTRWLRSPARRALRLVAATLLILGGCLSILPVLGLWMLPLGLALLAEDVPAIKPWLERSARWCERAWARFRRRGA